MDEMQTYTATVDINIAVPHKILTPSTSRPSYSTLKHISKGHSILPHGYLFNYVHSGFIHNGQRQETPRYVPQMKNGSKIVTYLYNGVLLSYWTGHLL